ncbi:hypothetical protein TIFTF001_004342 [Ficus carica]|uniref:Uncharacterized protein n=1 Tax=Ficus carica TaxID=3494 RepID=A0AA88CXQ0_FICCA|nr:hypothetical protein TIFTF001_004342 [Ficus carica]
MVTTHSRGSRRLETMRTMFTMVRGSSQWQIWVRGAWFTETRGGGSGFVEAHSDGGSIRGSGVHEVYWRWI